MRKPARLDGYSVVIALRTVRSFRARRPFSRP
jgi:hypothetical protein